MLLVYIVLAVLGGLALFGCLVILALRTLVNGRSIKTRGWNPDAGHTVLAVFAHPDDEVMVCGTLARVKRAGGMVHCLYLTRGEDGPTGGIVEKEKLGEYRENELARVREIIKADNFTVMRYPDRYLNTVDKATLQGEILRQIEQHSPDAVICFDDALGLYGHPDHAYSGLCTAELLHSKDPHGVQTLLVMTLPSPMIALAQKLSKTFKERYDAGKGLPEANLSVAISRFARCKIQVVRAHKTQWQVMKDVQPLHDRIPYFIYYRIFSREYYRMEPLSSH
ncbi:MAG: PIG-L family deacetylase [Treponema sp.]|nr:PIG-L family deacetylase [Treponema sp.]